MCFKSPQCAATFPWLRGLSFLTIRRAMLAGTLIPGRDTQAKQAKGEETDKEQHRPSDETLNRGPVCRGALPLCTLKNSGLSQGIVFWTKFPAPGFSFLSCLSTLFRPILSRT